RVEQVAVLINLERPFDRDPAALDDDVLETGRLRLRNDVEGCLAGFAGQLDPTGENIVELELGQIGFDTHSAVVIGSDLANELDGEGTRYLRSEIKPEPRAARVVERRLQFEVAIAR